MALLTTYTSANEVVTEGLTIRYSIEMDNLEMFGWHPIDPANPSGGWGWGQYDLPYYRCTRYATKRYSFVGMDYATALTCAAEKIAKYTRAYSQIAIVETTQQGVQTKSLTTQTSTLCSSDVAPIRSSGGGAYSVEISVNETDEKPSTTFPSNVASLFTAENARDYD